MCGETETKDVVEYNTKMLLYTTFLQCSFHTCQTIYSHVMSVPESQTVEVGGASGDITRNCVRYPENRADAMEGFPSLSGKSRL